MKKFLKKIPFIGPLALKIRRKFNSRKFNSTEDYWVDRYKSGGNSGEGSYNKFAEYKGEVINQFVQEKNIQTAIELGCGDGNQLSYFRIPYFTGYEVSPDAVELCKKRFKNDQTKSFFLYSEFKPQKADLTLSLDVVYCLVEDGTYELYLNRLFDSSGKFVIVYSSNHDQNLASVAHIKHRKFTKWVEIHKPEFKLIRHLPNKFADEVSKSSNSEWYFFERT